MPRYQWVTSLVFKDPYLVVKFDNGDGFSVPAPPWYSFLSAQDKTNWRETDDGIQWVNTNWSLHFPGFLAHVKFEAFTRKSRRAPSESGDWVRERLRNRLLATEEE